MSSSTGGPRNRERLVDAKSSLAARLAHVLTLSHSHIDRSSDVSEITHFLRTAEECGLGFCTAQASRAYLATRSRVPSFATAANSMSAALKC